MQEAQAPAEVAEEDQLFAEDAQGERYVAQLAGEGDRLPEAPQELAGGRVAAHVRQLRRPARHISAQICSVGDIPEGPEVAMSRYTTARERKRSQSDGAT